MWNELGTIGLLILLTVFGAFSYRARGMGDDVMPGFFSNRTLRRAVFAVLIGMAAFAGGVGWQAALLIPVVVWAGVVLGHGSYMDLGTGNVPDNEKFKWFLDLIFGPEPPFSFKRDFVGLCLTGLLITVPAAAVTFYVGHTESWIYAFVGIGKGLAYAVPLKLKMHNFTEWGEFFWGGICVGGMFLLA